MAEESRDDTQTSTNIEESKKVVRLGIGRGKPLPENTNNEPPPVGQSNNSTFNNTSTWNSSSTNDENSSKSSGTGGFGGRSFQNTSFNDQNQRGGYDDNREYRSSNRNDRPRNACYNCGETDHKIRDCPKPREERNDNRYQPRSDHSNYRSDGHQRNVNFSSSGDNENTGLSVTVDNSRHDNGFHKRDDRAKSTNNTWQSGSNYENESNDNAPQTNFSSSMRGGHTGFRSSRGGGGARQFDSGENENRSSGANSNNCYNCGKPGHRQFECPEPKKPRESSNFHSGRNDQDRNVPRDHSDGQSRARPTERYIPPPPPTEENDVFGKAVTRGENFNKYHRATVHCTPENKIKPIEIYDEANLNTQILSNIRRAHFDEPTPIQRYTIPAIRQQCDIMACAQTGSGKTAAFLVPIISNLIAYNADELQSQFHPPAPFCLILSPTRELALQTEREARKFAFETGIIPHSAVGGHDSYTFFDRIRDGCHILSATTGRLMDVVRKGRVSLKRVKYFVLDEADRMLDQDFEKDIRSLEDLGLPPKEERFTSMFSATFPEAIQRLAKDFLRNNYIFLTVGTPGAANEDITQTIEEVPSSMKKSRLLDLLDNTLQSERCLIFVEQKRSADYLGSLLSQKNLMSTTMHGDRTQQQRNEAVQQFTAETCRILVATSVAARGLDFPLIGYVVNYDLPESGDFYVHRIGRTGRAGHLGKSISFFDPERESDRRIAGDLITRLTEAGQPVPDFLQKYATESNTGVGQGQRNTDIRTGQNNRNQTSGFSSGTTSAGATSDDWRGYPE